MLNMWCLISEFSDFLNMSPQVSRQAITPSQSQRSSRAFSKCATLQCEASSTPPPLTQFTEEETMMKESGEICSTNLIFHLVDLAKQDVALLWLFEKSVKRNTVVPPVGSTFPRTRGAHRWFGCHKLHLVEFRGGFSGQFWSFGGRGEKGRTKILHKSHVWTLYNSLTNIG